MFIIISLYELRLNRRISTSTNNLINQDEIFKNSRVHHFDLKRNEEILEELNVERGDQKLRRYKSQWQRHARRMNNNRTPKICILISLIT